LAVVPRAVPNVPPLLIVSGKAGDIRRGVVGDADLSMTREKCVGRAIVMPTMVR